MDEDDFLACLLRHQDAIYAFINVLLPSRTDADDVFQDTCLILWKKREQFDAEKKFLSWARGIARNEVRAYCRKSSGRDLLFSNEIIELLSASQSNEARDESHIHSLLAECLAKLEPQQQQLLRRFYSDVEKVRSIAESSGTTPESLYVKVHRLRRNLLECIRRGLNREGAL